MVYCGDTCYFWDNKNCVQRRDCVCKNCAGLQSVAATLYEDCASACNSQDAGLRPQSKDDFLCSIGGEQLWGRYHLLACGYNPDQSYEAKMAKSASGGVTSKVVIGVLILGIIFLIVKLFTNAGGSTDK